MTDPAMTDARTAMTEPAMAHPTVTKPTVTKPTMTDGRTAPASPRRPRTERPAPDWKRWVDPQPLDLATGRTRSLGPLSGPDPWSIP